VSASPLVQVALLLDTSNSMDGLIGQAKSQLWRVVNELAAARRGGRPVRLQVALYEYGNSRLSATTGYVRRVLAFTDDLDLVSEHLFALTTSGGEEYCGTVIQHALDELAWSPSPGDYKVAFIAGNEPFSQGPVDYRAVSQRATRQGVVVNTIHCGPREVGLATGWAEGARIAYGEFSAIDQDRAVAHVAAPQDDELARLSGLLNDTYLPYGSAGASGLARQRTQDQNASQAGKGSVTERAATKAGRLYSNAGWDLVDAVRQQQVDLARVPAEDLPEPMRNLAPEARKAYVDGRAAERARLQARVGELSAARERHVAVERARLAGAGAETLDVAMARSLRAQAKAKGLELDEAR
jgi:hypothetical protein